jgi:two-component system, OmpR family, response regulator ChvI
VPSSRLTIDFDRVEVAWDEKPVPKLTRTEWNLMVYLSACPGHIKSRAQILEVVWKDQGLESYDRCVDTAIKRLKNKFKQVDPEFSMICSRYGFGYYWRDH